MQPRERSYQDALKTGLETQRTYPVYCGRPKDRERLVPVSGHQGG
jgi:hypothetical protein